MDNPFGSVLGTPSDSGAPPQPNPFEALMGGGQGASPPPAPTPMGDPQKVADGQRWLADRADPHAPPTPEFNFEQEFVRRMREAGTDIEAPQMLPDGSVAQSLFSDDGMGGVMPKGRMVYDPTLGQTTVQMLTAEGGMSPAIPFPSRQDAMEFIWELTGGLQGQLPPAAVLAEVAQASTEAMQPQGAGRNSTGVFEKGTSMEGLGEYMESGPVPYLPTELMSESKNFQDFRDGYDESSFEDDEAKLSKVKEEQGDRHRKNFWFHSGDYDEELRQDVKNLVDSGKLKEDAKAVILRMERALDALTDEIRGSMRRRQEENEAARRRPSPKKVPMPRRRRIDGEEE